MTNQDVAKARMAYERWNEGNAEEGALAIALLELAAHYETFADEIAEGLRALDAEEISTEEFLDITALRVI